MKKYVNATRGKLSVMIFGTTNGSKLIIFKTKFMITVSIINAL